MSQNDDYTPQQGFIALPSVAPIYLDGMPLDAVHEALALNEALLGQERGAAKIEYWSSPSKFPWDPIREVFEVNLTTPQRVNLVSFELAHYPHRCWVQYHDPTADAWVTAKTESGFDRIDIADSLPARIPAASLLDDNHIHPMHFGAGHWIAQRLKIRPITASRFRLVLVRVPTDKIPVSFSGEQIAYPLGVRRFEVAYEIASSADVPRLLQDPLVPTHSDVLSTTTDLLGSAVEFVVRQNKAQHILEDTDLIWRCEPQLSPDAVVNLYVDARDVKGEPQIIDRFTLDPVTAGPSVNIYYTPDEPVLNSTVARDDMLTFPRIRPYGENPLPTEEGIKFPNTLGYLDIDNQVIQFQPGQPWWIGAVFAPQFPSTDLTEQVLLDAGGLLIRWVDGGFRVSLGPAVVSFDGIEFSVNQQLEVGVVFDGDSLRIWNGEQERTTSADGLGVEVPSVLRFGGLVTAEGEDPLQGNYVLRNFILKQGSVDSFDTEIQRYWADPRSYVSTPEYAEDDDGSTNNAILRYDPSFWNTSASGSALPSTDLYGFLGGAALEFADVTWIPIARDYRLRRGPFIFNPVRARFFKLEFTKLTAEPYTAFVPLRQTMKLFPNDIKWRGKVPQTSRSGNNTSVGATVTPKIAHLTSYADQYRLFTNQPAPDRSYTPTEALYSSDPNTNQRLRNLSPYYGFQPFKHDTSTPRFPRKQKHYYQTVEVEQQTKVAYFVGLKDIQMFRVDYAVDDDTDQYIELFQDQTNFAVDSDGNITSSWAFRDDTIQTPEGSEVSATAQSKIFNSRRRVRGVQFATEQTPAVQLLTDPDFGDPTLQYWQATGDAQISASSLYNTDIGTTVQVSRRIVGTYWFDMQTIYPTWQDIEDSNPEPYLPTWDDLQSHEVSASEWGGVEGFEYVTPGRTGRVYAAARVFSPKTLSEPLYIQLIDQAGTVLAETAVDVAAGQVTEWFTSYTIGETAELGDQLTWAEMESTYATWQEVQDAGSWSDIDVTDVSFFGAVTSRLIQRGVTSDVWYVDSMPVFYDAIVWEFSNDGGLTWYPGYDIRNDPRGVLLFPDITALDLDENPQLGQQLVWRVSGYLPNLSVASLVIRPWYDELQLGVPVRETVQHGGPNVSLQDHYPPITEDPRFKLWHKPIPESWWFVYRQWLMQQFEFEIVQTPILVVPDTIAIPVESLPPEEGSGFVLTEDFVLPPE